MEALKPARRAAERARKKENKAHLRDGYASGTLTEEEQRRFEEKQQRIKDKQAADKRMRHGDKGDYWQGGVVIDLGFDELMTDQVSRAGSIRQETC